MEISAAARADSTSGAAVASPFPTDAPERRPETPMQRHVRRKAWGATWGAIMRDAWKATETGAQ